MLRIFFSKSVEAVGLVSSIRTPMSIQGKRTHGIHFMNFKWKVTGDQPNTFQKGRRENTLLRLIFSSLIFLNRFLEK